MSKIFSSPKLSVTPPPPAEDAAQAQTDKLQNARDIRVRALSELNSTQGQFIRKTGLRL